MKNKNKNLVLIIFLVSIFFSIIFCSYFSFAAGEFTTGSGSGYISSNAQYVPVGTGFSGSEGITTASLWPRLDNVVGREVCNRQDFIVQIASAGCKPTVVRSDLLAEQDVAVFCQLQAIQINPSIKAEYIKNINIQHTGKFPEGVKGAAFYSPRAYFSYQKSISGFATANNIGYAIIVLNRQPNENNMSDYVEGNLTLKMTYHTLGGFGTGLTEKTIPVLSEDEWIARYPEFVFLDGKAYLRVEKVDSQKVLVSIYSDVNHRFDSFTLQKGESQEKSISGDYCGVGYKMTYLDATIPEKKATLEIGGDRVDLYAGEKFANDACQITSIKPLGAGMGNVTGWCRTGSGSTKSFSVNIGLNAVKLTIGVDNERTFDVGDEVGVNSNVFLAAQSIKKENNIPFIVLVKLKEDEKFNSVLKEKSRAYAEKISRISDESEWSNDEFAKENSVLVIKKGEKKAFVDGFDIEFSDYFNPNSKIKSGDNKFDDYFNMAIGSYKVTNQEYGNTPFNNEEFSNYGIASLTQAIYLSKYVGNSVVDYELIKLFKENYPDSSLPVIDNYDNIEMIDSSGAIQVVDIQGVTTTIRLVSVENQDPKHSGVIISVDGIEIPVTSEKEYLVSPYSDSEKKQRTSILLETYDAEKVRISGKCYDNEGKLVDSQTEEIGLGGSKAICGKVITINELNFQQDAKIRVEPIIRNAGTDINISYKIGIEKRAIKLNPAKTAERIKTLNETIVKWEDISKSLGSSVKTLKAACLVTSAALQIKNLFSNLGGGAIARQEVMQSEDGWDDMCADAMSHGGNPSEKYSKLMVPGPYVSLDDCYGKNAKLINSDVSFMTQKISSVNEEISNFEENGGFVKSGGLFGGNVVDTDGARKAYIQKLQGQLGNSNLVLTDENGENKVDVGEIMSTSNLSIPYDQAREIRLYTNILSDSGASSQMKKLAERNLYGIMAEVKETAYVEARANSVVSEVKNSNVVAGNFIMSTPPLPRGQNADVYDGAVVSARGENYGKPVQGVLYQGEKYYLVLKELNNNQYSIEKIYRFNADNSIGSEVVRESEDNSERELWKEINNQHQVFKRFDEASYNNPFKEEAVVRYYETEPYKGMPSVVPIDNLRGWYAATKQTLPVGENIESYQDSGRVSSFWLCNVGKNGRVEFDQGVGDDICQMFNMFTGQPTNTFNGLSEKETSTLVSKALQAIQQAANQYKSGVTKVTILGKSYKVGNPAINNPGAQCQDFMSPSDCKLMFNVCDPVICPASRCNLGGKYYVNDVVQSGIFGSLFLCLPNYREGIIIPVCLTGVQAGVDNYISILKASRDCLQENLNSGKYVGICDELTAIYTCEFFWRQAAPLMKVIIPKLLEMFVGGGTRGGGEYLNVQSAWSNMESSVSYLTTTYAPNAMKSFKIKSTEEAGTPVCKAFVSVKFAKKFQNLIEPESPSQFSAWFDEIKQTSVTIPATSQYKVYYHIYAGKDQGTYYSIYLKDSPGESFYTSSGIYLVATGYINKGEYADEAADFTGPSGFQQLCVRINYEEKCGFKQVSTSFAINYLRDTYIENQMTNTQIASEKECISGSVDALALINPNLEAGVQETISPSIYQRGVMRICATDNPGSTTEPERWQDVGNCGDTKIRCWLDKNSVADAFTAGNVGVRNKTMAELNQAVSDYINNEKEGMLGDEISWSKFREIEEAIQTNLFAHSDDYTNAENMEKDATVILAKLDQLDEEYILDETQQARVSYDKSRIQDSLARVYYHVSLIKQKEDIAANQGITEVITCEDLEGYWVEEYIDCLEMSATDVTNDVHVDSRKEGYVCCKPIEETNGETETGGENEVNGETTGGETEGEVEETVLSSDSTIEEKTVFACIYFQQAGYSKEQTAGIIGNLMQESQLDPKNIGDNMCTDSDAYGLAQWCNERRTKVENYIKEVAIEANKDDSDFNIQFAAQLHFILVELDSTYSSAKTDLLKQTTVSGAALSFRSKYERPSAQDQTSRVNYANEAYEICKNINLESSSSGSSSKKVCLDAGHLSTDDYDRGFVDSPCIDTNIDIGKCNEGRNNEFIVDKIDTKLKLAGYTTVLTRPSQSEFDGDSDSEINLRWKKANEEKCDIFISIHSNAYDGSSYGINIFLADEDFNNRNSKEFLLNNFIISKIKTAFDTKTAITYQIQFLELKVLQY